MLKGIRTRLSRRSNSAAEGRGDDPSPLSDHHQRDSHHARDDGAEDSCSSCRASAAPPMPSAVAHPSPQLVQDSSAPSDAWSEQLAGWAQLISDGSRQSDASPSARRERFTMIRELGRGGTSVVMLALDNATLQRVAVKRIPLAAGFKRTTIIGELLNHSLCSGHPHIIQLQEVYLTRDHLCVVMELAEGGDLAQRMEELHHYGVQAMPEEEARWIFQQLLVAVDYCQRLGVANRDIKLDNMMVHGFWPWPTIKMCDFGFSKDETRQSACDTSCGTPEYIAPEILLKGTYVGRMADAWSAGVALYAILNGAFPFARAEDNCENEVVRVQRMFTRILQCQMAPVHGLSAEGMDLLRRLLDPNPASRLSVQQALHHPWVAADMPPGLQGLNNQLLAVTNRAGQRQAPGTMARHGCSQGYGMGCRQTPDELKQIVEQASRAHLSSGSMTSSFMTPLTSW